MNCLKCHGVNFTEIWLYSSGHTDELHLTSQLTHSKVPLPDERAVGVEWYTPSPRVRTFCCTSCGFLMNFVELNDEIKVELDKLRGF